MLFACRAFCGAPDGPEKQTRRRPAVIRLKQWAGKPRRPGTAHAPYRREGEGTEHVPPAPAAQGRARRTDRHPRAQPRAGFYGGGRRGAYGDVPCKGQPGVEGKPFAFALRLRGRAYLQIREIRRKAVSGGGRMPWGRGRGASGVVQLRRMKGTLPTRRAKRKSSCLRLCAACVCFYFFAFFRPST